MLPIASETMYILSEGEDLAAGAINVYEDSDNKLIGSDIHVDIHVYYDSPEVQKATSISLVHAAHESGVRIHVSTESFGFTSMIPDQYCFRLPLSRTHICTASSRLT
jgi:hypothetical protein